MKRAEIEAISRGISSAVREHLDAELRTIRREMEVLRETALHDAGTWREGTTYRRSAVATYRGTIWCAREETTDRPGTSSAWRLMTKSANDSPRREHNR